MISMRAVVRIFFCSRHRVSEPGCSRFHSHYWQVLIYAKAACLDSFGRVIDFAVLKDRVGGWLTANWDGITIVCDKDTPAIDALKSIDQPMFLLPYSPTAENLAYYLLTIVAPALFEGTGVEVDRIDLWETENAAAQVEL